MNSSESHHLKVSEMNEHGLGAAPDHLVMFNSMLESRKPHESDFYAYALFENKDCIFFDIGANIGTSALSIHFVQPTWSVISFEPNAALNPFLDRVRKEFESHGASFEVFNVGLGSVATEAVFYMPRIGDWNVVGEASFSLEHFSDPHVARRLSNYSATGQWELLKTSFPIVRFDEFEPVIERLKDIRPNQGIFVKIDVEGFEEDVLRGMSFFLKTYRPMLMIENTPGDHVQKILFDLGYSAYEFNMKARILSHTVSREGLLNIFYIHDSFIESGDIEGIYSR